MIFRLATAAAILTSTALAGAAFAETPVPPLIAQIEGGNWLPQTEAEALRDELFYQRAILA